MFSEPDEDGVEVSNLLTHPDTITAMWVERGHEGARLVIGGPGCEVVRLPIDEVTAARVARLLAAATR